ncbi:MAG TPA: DUF2147 domain-containing protein [Candidatus Thioglobus sp.]|jgi:uncharacterized protein (DUF2147 family)|nr:DUF2147 domain-containing protein [Candidatus Thioglobus sp.]HIL20083.1 DUF2147 domain-containing protein [Candidatus Thioglobus sp.]
MIFSISISTMFKNTLKIRLLALIGLLFVSAASVANTEGDRLLGFWFTENDNATVEIYREGDGYFGRIVALKNPLYADDTTTGLAGQAKVDRNNPDPDKQDFPIVGLNLLRGFAYIGNNKWRKGKIYDPENGKDYDCNIKLKSDGTLSVRGYIGLALFGRTTIWRRTISPEE